VSAAQYEPGQLNAAAGALIRAAITDDGWTAQRAAALAEDVPGGYLYFVLLVARVAGAMLVEASGSKAQAAALASEWVNESVKTRARKAA
jgi:hypothetical protein